MAKPSWFESSNNILELSEQPVSANMHPLGSLENLQRVRGLWLISFIQDMGTFTSNSPELRLHGLRQYPNVLDAILLLQADMKRYTLDSYQEEACTSSEFARLWCLFFISVLIQASGQQYSDAVPPASVATAPNSPDNLATVNDFLQIQNIWAGTVEQLFSSLFNDFNEIPESTRVKEYVFQITNVLSSLSCEARRGVEKCLLLILGNIGSHGTSLDDYCTPDTLLSSLHGL